MEFDVVLEKQRSGYTAYVPALPGCISEGNTKTEAMRNIKEAIELFLEEKGKSKNSAVSPTAA
ncbi:MAG: type II toxin-antitoxin system HicB family antitoxin [archaeon]